jgi:chromosome segregation ATPase
MIGFLLANWKPLVAGLGIIAFSAYIGIIKHERDSARLERDTLKTQIQQYKLQVDNLDAQINDWKAKVDFQNAKIDQMNISYHAMQLRVDEANKKVQQIVVDSVSKLDALKHYYESIPDSDSCSAIKDILDAPIPSVH